MHTDERGIFDGTIRAGIANAIGIDELLQLDTGHLKFIPLELSLWS